MKFSTLLFLVDVPSGAQGLLADDEAQAANFVQITKLAVIRMLYSILSNGGEWGYKFFDSSSNSLSGTVSKSEHVYPVDTNNIDIFTTALREIVRQRILASKRGISATAAGPSRSPANRIASCIGQIFIDFHLKPPSTLLDAASAKTLIVLLSPCPHSALELYSFITSEEDHIRQKTHGYAGLSMNDVGVVTRSKFANIFNSLGEKLKSVQSQLIWLDTREAMNMHGADAPGFKFSPFDAKEVVHVSQDEKKEALNFGFTTMAQCLAELKGGQIASLVSFETALVLDANNMFSMRSLLLEHVISACSSSASSSHVNVFPAALFTLEKPPRSTSSTLDHPLLLCDFLELRALASSAAPLWINARLLSGDGSSSNKKTMHSDPFVPTSVFQVHFAHDDRKSQLLRIKSSPSSIMMESSSSQPPHPAPLKFSIRGLIRNVHVSPAWIAGSTMILVPSPTASASSHDDSHPQQAPLSPRKAPVRLASTLYRPPPQSPVFASFLAYLAAEDSCAVIDLPATSFLLTPATATSAFVFPLNDALQVLTKQIAAATSKRAQQQPPPQQQQQQQRPMTRQSNPNPTLKSLFPPGFYYTADSAAFNSNPSKIATEVEIASDANSSSVAVLDFAQNNLRLPLAPKPTIPSPSAALEKIAESYYSRISLILNKGDNRQQQQREKENAHADDDDDDNAVTFRKEDSDDEAEDDDIANLIDLYNKLVQSSGGSGDIEAPLLKQIEHVVFTCHVNQSDFDGTPAGTAISQALLKPLSDLLGPSNDEDDDQQAAQPALRKLRERRLQVALRFESCRGGDLSFDSKALRRSPRRHAPPSPTKNSSSSSLARPKLSALLELDATIRDEILQLLESIRLFLDAEREQGFISYFSQVLVDTWITKCPFTLFWQWRQLELEKSLLPENLKSAVAILFPSSSAAANNKKKLAGTQATPQTGLGQGLGRRSRSVDLSFDDGIDSVSKLSDEMMDTSPLAELSNKPRRQLRSKRKLMQDSPSPSLSALDFTESFKRRKLFDGTGQAQSQEHQAGPLSSLSSSSGSTPAQPPTQPLSRSGSGVSTRSKQLAESLSFSAEDILNKFIPTTIAHTKPQAEVKYIPKPRPESPPKSPQRPTRSYSTSQLNFSYRK